jgi:hypothetical protein
MRTRSQLTPPDVCFSIIFKTWTLDFQVEATDVRNKWASAIATFVEEAKRGDLE